jgi:hypothetical protein
MKAESSIKSSKAFDSHETNHRSAPADGVRQSSGAAGHTLSKTWEATLCEGRGEVAAPGDGRISVSSLRQFDPRRELIQHQASVTLAAAKTIKAVLRAGGPLSL